MNPADNVAAATRLEGMFISSSAFAAIGERPRPATQVDMDLGVETGGLTMAQSTLDARRCPTVEERGVLYRQLDGRLAGIPNVKGVIVSAWPRGGGLVPEVSIERRETAAGAIPALRATRLNPVDALRNEVDAGWTT